MIDPPNNEDIYELYAAAVEIADPVACDAFIQSHCSHDPGLLQRLRSMVSAREDADALFNRATESECVPGQTDSEDPAPLGRVGRFRLVRLVGRGGMGNVFLGYDEQLQRPAALKFPRIDTMGSPEMLDRFLREARLAAKLNHPSLVEIYEVGVWGQACFIASQWCEGGDLSTWLAEHPGPQHPQWAAELMRTVTRAVAYCHQQGVVHLDLKPANIILSGASDQPSELKSTRPAAMCFKPMLTDFGVARVVDDTLTATHTSLLLGTPLYMSPEQAECQRDRIGPCSDIFALGVILHELLFGKRPFEGQSAIEVLDQVRSSDTLVLPADRTVPRDLRTICQRCLEHDPAARYPSADALAEDLDRFLRGEPVHARPVSQLRRFARWLERPQRIVQAGVTSLAIQLMIVVDLLTVLAVLAFGQTTTIDMGALEFARETLLLILFPHLPSVIAAWMAMRGRRWPVPLGLFLSLFTAGMLVRVLVTGESHLALYAGHPLATFLQHFLLLCAMVIQAAAYAAAIPAALRRA